MINPAFRYKLYTLIAVAITLFLTACKVDLTQEIRFNKDLSGKALIKAEVSYPNLGEELVGDDQSLTEENVLQEYINKIEKTPGAKLISSAVKDNSTEEETIISYLVEFNFKDIQTLSEIISMPDTKAFTGAKKQLKIYPPHIAIINAGELEEPLGDLSMFEINYHLDVYTAKPIKNHKLLADAMVDKKHVKWDIPIDQEWLETPMEEITLKF